jgi:hypothetical protein
LEKIMRLILAVIVSLFSASALLAQAYEPARGSTERSSMLDAIRAHAEENLGAPVEFVVHDLRVDGTLGFASVSAQRPGGGAIDVYQTPGYRMGVLDPEGMDGTSMQALMRLSGESWVAVHWAIGATDVWFSYAPFCRRYRPVIADYCEGVN